MSLAASGGVIEGYQALWVADSYQGAPVNDITLAPQAVSDLITVTFQNEGPGTWDNNTVLAVWDGANDGPPADGTQFCHPAGGDWQSCAPGIAAWIGYGQVAPGDTGTFQFQLQAPATAPADPVTLNFRPAEVVNGAYHWIDAQPGDGLPGNRTYETFTVHVTGTAQTQSTSAHTALHDPNGTILFVHGFKATPITAGSSDGWDCQTDSWGMVEAYMRQQHVADPQNGIAQTWTGPMVTLGYYGGDRHCDDDLHRFQSHCSSYEAGNERTSNESIYHLSCLLAWKIWEDYSQHGTNVEIVAHSMGGLITRNALYQVQHHKSPAMPPGPLLVSDVVTIATPHGGVPSPIELFFPLHLLNESPYTANLAVCGQCKQFLQMNVGSLFMNEMASSAQNPQGGNGGTDWTLIGQGGADINGVPTCDFANVQLDSEVYMDGGQRVVYEQPCYDHGGYMTDPVDISSATALVCDSGCVRPPAAGQFGNNWHEKANYPHAIARIFQALFMANY